MFTRTKIQASNQTSTDAHVRYFDSGLSNVEGASEEYLQTLAARLRALTAEVEGRLASRAEWTSGAIVEG